MNNQWQVAFFLFRFALRECHIFMEKSSEAVAHILVSEGRKATQFTHSKKVTFFKKTNFLMTWKFKTFIGISRNQHTRLSTVIEQILSFLRNRKFCKNLRSQFQNSLTGIVDMRPSRMPDKLFICQMCTYFTLFLKVSFHFFPFFFVKT